MKAHYSPQNAQQQKKSTLSN